MDFNCYMWIYIGLFLVSLAILLTRCYVRVKINKAFHAEDWFAVAAIVLMFIETVLSILFTKDYFLITDIGHIFVHFPRLEGFYPFLKRMLEIQTGSYLAFMLSLWCIKYSFLFFYRRLSSGLAVSKFWVFTIIVCTLALAGNIVGFFFSCIPLSTYWDGSCNFTQRKRNNATLWAFTITDIWTDILVMIIPLRLLHQLRISRNQKIGLCFLFCLGILVIIMSVARTLRVEAGAITKTLDPKWVAVWSMAEQATAMVVCCLPAIRKLFKVKAEKHGHFFSPTAFHRRSFPKWSFMSNSSRSRSSTSPTKKHHYDHNNLAPLDVKNTHVLSMMPISPGRLEAGLAIDYDYPAKSPELPPPVKMYEKPIRTPEAVVEFTALGSTGSGEDLSSPSSSTDGSFRFAHGLPAIRTRTVSYDIV